MRRNSVGMPTVGSLVAALAVGVHSLVVPPPWGGTLPAEIAETLDPKISPSEVLPLWRELRRCYPSESAAIRAAQKNQLVILPFINTADNIRCAARCHAACHAL